MSKYKLYPLNRRILLERLKREQDLRNVFKKNIDLTELVNEDISQRLIGDIKNWVLIQITGETGSMKSSVGVALAKNKLDNNMVSKNITQQYTEFERLLANSKPNQCFILDELVFQRGIGSTRMKENILNLVETLRKRQNSMIFITPTEKFITDDNVTFTLEPIGFCEETKTVRCLVRKNIYLGFCYVKLLWDEPLWKEYEKDKDAFMEQSSKQNYQKMDYEYLACKLLMEMPSEYQGKKKRIRLYLEKKAPNMTGNETELLMEQISMFMVDGMPQDIVDKINEEEADNLGEFL